MDLWRRGISGGLVLALAAFFATAAAAVEPAPIKIGERWSIVGVISSDSEAAGAARTGIAVLRNNTNKRTYTLSIGDSLPNEFGFTLQSVRGRAVTIGDGQTAYALSFAEAPVEEAEPVSRTARFIDNYYRSVGIDTRQAPDEELGTAPSEPDYVPVDQLDAERGDRSRFELYRAERRYRPLSEAGVEEETSEAREQGEDEGFVVNYDNFVDDGGERATGDYGEGASGDGTEPLTADEIRSAVEDLSE